MGKGNLKLAEIIIGLAVTMFAVAATAVSGEEKKQTPQEEKQSIISELIFPPDPARRYCAHASCIVECPNEDLLVCWYEGKTDKSDDVHIRGARLVKHSDKWSETFVMADTPGLSDNNPCMVIDHEKRLWLFYGTLLGAPEKSWGSAFLRYKISTEYQDPTKPIRWVVEHDLSIKPTGSLVPAEEDWFGWQTRDVLDRRLGWLPRAHPTILESGTLILPLGSDNFYVAIMALTSDGGKTWSFSGVPYGTGVIQPSIVERSDGTLVAYMRDAMGVARRIRMSTSLDKGKTWSDIVSTDLPNPGAGIEAIRLTNNEFAIVYNDTEKGRDSLAMSISDDEGESWKWTRHLESQPGKGFSYPSLIQSRDGNLHVTYSYNIGKGDTIKHAKFSAEWVKAGDKTPE